MLAQNFTIIATPNIRFISTYCTVYISCLLNIFLANILHSKLFQPFARKICKLLCTRHKHWTPLCTLNSPQTLHAKHHAHCRVSAYCLIIHAPHIIYIAHGQSHLIELVHWTLTQNFMLTKPMGLDKQ